MKVCKLEVCFTALTHVLKVCVVKVCKLEVGLFDIGQPLLTYFNLCSQFVFLIGSHCWQLEVCLFDIGQSLLVV